MCSPLPIDVVYTWVNGTDPVLLHNLAALKLEMEVSRAPRRARLRHLPTESRRAAHRPARGSGSG